MIARRELEISIGWAQAHPKLFSKSLMKFHLECKETNLTLTKADRSRDGFVTYIAEAMQ
jgi:hypothetical protein